MSSRSAYKLLSLLTLLAISIQPVGPALAQGTTPPVNAAAAHLPAAASGMLYRTTVHIATQRDLARLEKLGVAVLTRDTAGKTAVVLVDAEQLETLARLRFEPRASDDADALVAVHAQEKPWLAAAWGEVRQRMAADKRMNTASALASLSTSSLSAALAGLTSVDDDGDGLTNTEEAWWCTDPMNPNSDGDVQGYTDGQEVTALLDFTLPRATRWGYGPPFGPPNAWPNFNDRDGTHVNVCNDGDFDTIPDYAEVYMVGTRVPEESTDHDKFDDGQELFGVTFCPGAPTNCGYGSYPAVEYWNYIQASMPNWVLPPGDNPLVAAFPQPEVNVTPGSWHVTRVTTITTSQGQMTQTEHSYETSATQGQSTSIADTVSWNNWEEVSQAIETPLLARPAAVQALAECTPAGSLKCRAWGATKLVSGGLGGLVTGVGATGLGALCVIPDPSDLTIIVTPAACVGAVALGGVSGRLFSAAGSGWKDMTAGANPNDVQDGSKTTKYDINNTNINSVSTNAEANASIILNQDFDFQGVVNSLDGVQYAINQQGELLARGLHDISYQLSRPRLTETHTNGRSWGGAQTTTHEVYEEHTIAEGQAFTTGENWSTAWAVDSSHAADLTFEFTVKNTGTEYARELTGMIVNVYIGDDTSPSISYPAWEKFPSGVIQNLFPGASHTFTSNPIPLNLDQMRRIDLGERLTVVVEDYSYGADELFYQNAVSGGMTIFIEDGVEDGDESVDSYVIPTWGNESVLDVLTRYFPAGYDAEDNLNALWTPEFDGANPPTWHEHYLSDIAWWNVYLTQADAGNTPLKDIPSQAGAAMLFRFNRDADRDGYNDRAEFRYYCALPASNPDHVHCADGYLLPEVHPQPQVLAGYVVTRTAQVATVKLAIENTGTFDAYGIDAMMYSPDGTTTIGNNTVGGNGRARPGQHVAVGSLVKPPAGLQSTWGASTAKPYSGGNFTGAADRTYSFTAQTPGVVGQGATAVNWSDGQGITGTLSLGNSYHAPLPLDLAAGLQVGFNTGTILPGASFTVQALTPRDTFTYTINSEPFIPPVIVVSYSDPQGSHRFVTSVELAALDAPLAAHAGEMLGGLKLAIVTEAGLAPTGSNTTKLVVNSPHPETIHDAQLHLNFVSDGVLVLEKSYGLDIPAGPTVFPATWSVSEFSADYHPAGDNLLIAFWTDSEGNIIDSAARPLNSFTDDPDPALAMATADETWDFGAAQQGTLLQRTFTLGSVGYMDLLTYLGTSSGMTVAGPTARSLPPGDTATYTVTLNTQTLPVGAFEQTIPVRTSDPVHPEKTIIIRGNVTAMPPDAPGGATIRPLDWSATVSGNQGDWVEFTHTLGPEPQTLHPVKVYSQDYATLKGVGKYATPFGAGTASYDMFGDGRDGVMPSSGNLDNNNGVGVGIVNSGSAGAYSINVTDAYAGGRINPGDVVLIHQTQGTGAGCWELNKAVTDYVGGTAAIQLAKPLQCNYITSGVNHAQVQRVPQYTDCPVSGTVTPLSAWNGTWGGIFAVMCNGTMTLTGNINANDGGFRGGPRSAWPGHDYYTSQGEGTPGVGTLSNLPNGNGGGGGRGVGGPCGGGGGGGNGSIGSNGETIEGPGGYGGYTSSNQQLAIMTLGGGGGAGGDSDNAPEYGGSGSSGGGAIFMAGRSLTVSGIVTADGAAGANASWAQAGAGGGGAGGSILVQSETATLGSARILARGGTGGSGISSPRGGNGGAGGSGRIRVEYCETPPAFTTNPDASTQKLNCYIADQATDPTHGLLNLPESGTHTYQVQYGRKLDFSGAGEQVKYLRVPAAAFTSTSLDALISNVGSGALNFKLDIGNDGTWDWDTTPSVTDAVALTNTGLAAAFNAYWATHGAPLSGAVDVPVRVYLSKAGQVLLTNLQVTPTGSKLRHLRLPVRPQGYSSVTASFTVSGGAGPLAVGVDVGDNGSVDWAYSGSPGYPASLTTGDLASAVNAYLAGKSGEVDVPIRFTLAPFATLNLTGFSATLVARPDVSIGSGDVTFSNPSPTETDAVTVAATVHNGGALDSGPLTASFFATPAGVPPAGGTPWYIGSAFLPSIGPGGSGSASISWNTTGFTGTVPVRVVVDPFNRIAESDEGNNQATANLTIKTRPDIQFTDFQLSDPEPVAGEAVTVTLALRNNGQTAAGDQTVALYDGNPDADGTLVGATGGSPLPGGATTDIAFAWTPTALGPHRLFARADKDRQVNEYDEGNNDTWRDVYAGFGAPVALDSGTPAADPSYTPALGYGAVDTGQPDAVVTCSGHTDPTLRRDPDNRVGYRFDHLQPGRFYHLDVVLYECDNAGRIERVLVDDMQVAGPVDLGDQGEHRLSIRLDPAFYRDHVIQVAVVGAEGSLRAAVVASVALREVDYRYTDSGGPADPPYTPERGWGYLDTSSVAITGTLPYRSARVDQDDAELRYRFDRLDPAKRYTVQLTFWQATGNPLLERIQADGLSTGTTINLVAGTIISTTVRLSPATYQDDRSVVVGVVVLNASTNATVNEIALEEETLLTESPCRVVETPNQSFAFGYVTVNGAPAPVGSVITAESPRGDVVGCMMVAETGLYPFMPIYGEDTSASPAIPGMRDGELASFRVDGAPATATPLFYWHNDWAPHQADLAAAPLAAQAILLQPNWNLVSFRVEPPVPLVESVLSSIAGKYCRVHGEQAVYDCSIPAQFRSLKELHAAKAYYLRLDGGASANLLVEGVSVPVTTSLPLHQGWNWIGYLPSATLPVTQALESIAGAYQRVLSLNQYYDTRYPPSFSTLKQMAPGQGYLIYATQVATLTYPSTLLADLTGVPTPVRSGDGCQVTPTPELTLLFGYLRLAGEPAPAGMRVEAVTPRGEVAGCASVEEAGQYGFMAVYGEDGTATPAIPGFREGEPIRLRVNGTDVALPEPAAWHADRSPHQVDIGLAGPSRRIWLPIIVK